MNECTSQLIKCLGSSWLAAGARAANKGLLELNYVIEEEEERCARSVFAMLDRLEEYKVAIKTTASVLFLLTSLLLCLSLHLPPFLVPAPVFVTVGSVAALSVWGLLYLVLNSNIDLLTEPPAEAG